MLLELLLLRLSETALISVNLLEALLVRRHPRQQQHPGLALRRSGREFDLGPKHKSKPLTIHLIGSRERHLAARKHDELLSHVRMSSD